MTTPTRTELAIDLMTRFSERTGVTGEQPARRYLWTDAFAVCNWLGLWRATGDERFASLALGLVDQVHDTLGQHRKDDARSGWLGAGALHPTSGGLRIGKPLAERKPGEPRDEQLEWERDGQYFHYLTKWMHALDQVARTTGRATFNLWARELAHAAHGAFTYLPRGAARRRMYWKLSIDLSRPLVESMGQHDPLDGFLTCVELEASAAALAADAGPHLEDAARELATMIDPRGLATADPLGIGGLLVDAHRVEQLMRKGALPGGGDLLEWLLAGAQLGLRHYLETSDLRAPAVRRLAFRELGLAIGLRAVRLMALGGGVGAGGRARLEELAHQAHVGVEIEAFWCRPEARRVDSWQEHADINDVMLATSLAPEGFLVLASGAPSRGQQPGPTPGGQQ